MDRQAPNSRAALSDWSRDVLPLVRTAVRGWGPHCEPAPPRALLPREAGRQERQSGFLPTWVLRPAGEGCIQNGAGWEP